MNLIENLPFIEPEESAERSENLWVLREKCTPYLPPVERLIMMYIFDLEMSEREIAKKMNVSQVFVSKRKKMACKRLKKIYRDFLTHRLKRRYYLNTKYSEKTT
jgi:RNA polymerase sigma factor (sigma-70 family)